MKSMKIMAYKERRGPLFTLVIPLIDSKNSWKIKAAIEDVIFNVIDKQQIYEAIDLLMDRTKPAKVGFIKTEE